MRYTRLFENINQSDNIASDTLNTQKFVSLLAQHKALLLRSDDDENPFNVNEFGNFISNLGLESYPYVGGAAPRRNIPVDAGDNIIFTANEAPPDQLIPFHHELAQVKNPPVYLFFYCDQPSEAGGETALLDSTIVYRYVNDTFPEFMEKLKKYGARYIRTIPAEDDKESPIGRSFYNTYQVKTKMELETKLDATKGLEYEWLDDGSLKVTSEPIPAIRFIEQQQNHAIYQWTFHNSVIAAFVGWEDSRNDRKKSIRFGNDEPMDESILESIAKFMDENKVSYMWKKGDVFALNNRLVMHSRNAFTGVRRVYASMWGDVDKNKNVVQSNLASPGVTNLSSLAVSNPLTFGMWRVEDSEKAAYNAIKSGYRRIDSACDYGNEEGTGRGIRRAIEEGIVKREDLYVTTKLWNTYHAPEHVPLAMDRSLRDLGLDYVDEYLIHFPISMEFVPFEKKYPPEWTNLDGKMVVVKNDINETWKAMESLVDAGKARCIGVSNFNCQHIRQVLSVARIRPTSLQIECHPHLSQEKIIRFAREAGMRVTVFSPLGGTSYISLNMATQDDLLFNNPLLRVLTAKYGKTTAQIMLRWAVQRNTLPISKTSSVKRMEENQALFDFYLHREDVLEINRLNLNRRYNDPGEFCEGGMGTFCPIYE
uniref:NADP-dependent oxidoreductase domain-containing protein n=1 Tax=Helicotheca tamesis TaxID=374047 RepID=A0A7S2I4B2_9STRA|mmetsp:Transcript_5361/g.7358  ORF Transcript_5361/g.7358 Transcript_5361/m.7358 type:complete len:651 (+) Transcript_5361:184-2136(+)|eukprot:CAMPEP_0185732346 /NCGR_PEP_ID=MMETSP1171-20130828/15833_1 /TAXON_ID=374046 /ORGANISM="Helicotheca tamensis, Strain CCMP826" /LENGTH=650 /DNA_ID=CAMNT_0028401805 /DNA_START=129 /DNA_END=2081 /DNA_ORIENTATION=-